MKKLMVLVFILALLIPAGAVLADPGKNAETFSATCEGFGTLSVVLTGEAGHTAGGIGIARTVYANGTLVASTPGRGFTTVWCTWTIPGDPTQYSGDAQVAPPGGR